MKVADYIVDKLIEHGVTNVFGIPGGVILRFIKAMEERRPELTPHLSYHEQMAGFEACGYAQASGDLGVAYATRGPGIMNMMTCIAEAYQESLPVLFITAHNCIGKESGMRYENNQEIDLTKCVSTFTKYSARINLVQEVQKKLENACWKAEEGRKGPVFLDIYSGLFEQEMIIEKKYEKQICNFDNWDNVYNVIEKNIFDAERPVLLIGDGLRNIEQLQCLEKFKIPIISSRGAQDLLKSSKFYYGYIGSHGTRYGNFILEKSDLIIAIGNRMAFPIMSETYYPMMKKKKIIRMDIDEKEFMRELPGSLNFKIDAKEFIKCLYMKKTILSCKKEWIFVCDNIKKMLCDYDITEPVKKLLRYMELEKDGEAYVCDVGNNEFWFSRAYEKCEWIRGKVFYSKAFGCLGGALGRAIGVYYVTKSPVTCIIGDQGFQYNIQELEYIAKWNIPIRIIILNNSASGMIYDHERKKFGENIFHVTNNSGYGVPRFKSIVESYGITYVLDGEVTEKNLPKAPYVYEIIYETERELIPFLPKGKESQNMEPELEKSIYDYINQM